jgi:hypothetical protein
MAAMRVAVGLGGVLLASLAIAWAAGAGRTPPPTGDPASGLADAVETAPDRGTEREADPGAGDAEEPDEGGEAGDRATAPPERSRAVRGDDGVFLAPPEREDYACRRPDVPIPEEPGCAAGAPYPACRWQLPDEGAEAHGYRVWRNTTPEHRWAQPGLVALVMAVARDHQHRWPGELLTIGDLDAPGPRHQTHDAGHDVDLYLENALMETNIGGGNYLDTYAGRPSRVVRMLRARVLDLAKNLATCAGGQLRIYYNDTEIITPFLAWFGERGLVSSVGPPMVAHNRLHRFHFHMTIADGMPPLPAE